LFPSAAGQKRRAGSNSSSREGGIGSPLRGHGHHSESAPLLPADSGEPEHMRHCYRQQDPDLKGCPQSLPCGVGTCCSKGGSLCSLLAFGIG
jgi:hypothetical protein